MKPWQPCKHCYLRDSYCENAEREQPCVPVQEYLESSYKIKQLQKNLEVSENEHYKTLQQLAIATKALREYAEDTYWWSTKYMDEAIFREKGYEIAQQALKEIDLVGT